MKGEFAKVGEPEHIFILGIDGNPAGLDRVEAKLADGVVIQPLRDYGALIVPIIVLPGKGTGCPSSAGNGSC